MSISLTLIICLTDRVVIHQVSEQAPGLVVVPAEEEGHYDGATGNGHPGEQEAIHQGSMPGSHTLPSRVSVTRPGAGE